MNVVHVCRYLGKLFPFDLDQRETTLEPHARRRVILWSRYVAWHFWIHVANVFLMFTRISTVFFGKSCCFCHFCLLKLPNGKYLPDLRILWKCWKPCRIQVMTQNVCITMDMFNGESLFIQLCIFGSIGLNTQKRWHFFISDEKLLGDSSMAKQWF